jgi:voltage-gated potassium channel
MDGSETNLVSERESILQQLDELLETPMTALAFIWLVLTIIDLTSGLPKFLEYFTFLIWAVFWIDYLLKLIIAPNKWLYIRRNFITLLALVLPALRIFRLARAVRLLRVARGGNTIRLVSSFNRGLRALRKSLSHRGFGYVLLLTLIVNALGAAGILSAERGYSDRLTDFGSALWWTAMMLTTMGSDYFPRSTEGRLLALLLAIYGFAIFGYVTASVASFFVDRDAAREDGELASASEIAELKRRLDTIQIQLEKLVKQQG